MTVRIVDRVTGALIGALALALIAVLAGLVNAGPLDPPGSPSSPSGVFGPGTPISSLPYTITSPGSYYLTGNLTGVAGQDGIKIESNDVTLDLRGFTLQGVPGSGNGVEITTGAIFRRAITVRNGTARGWGESGFFAQFIEGGVFDALTAEGNGLWGLVLGGSGAVLSNCSATRNGATGISATEATITGCTSLFNGGHGFQVTTVALTDCVSAYNSNNGIDSISSRIEACHVYQNGQIGIKAFEGDVISNKVMQNFGTGIDVTGVGSLVARNGLQSNSITGTGYGINVAGTVSRIEDNHVVDLGNAPAQDVGIRVTGAENIVIGNSAHDNVVNYDLSGLDGSYGPLQNAASATSPFANIEY